MNKIFTALGYKIHISESCFRIIGRHIQHGARSHESGGMLLGQVVNDSIYVQRVTTPNRFDRSGRNYFVRDKDAAQLILDYEFLNSDQTVTYLGEWHTHPENLPTPSGQDRKMISGQFVKGVHHVEVIILFIQGIKDYYLALYDGERLRIAQRT